MPKEINIYHLGKDFWRRNRKKNFIISTIVSILVAIYIFSIPRYYSATTQVIPESSDENGLNLPKDLSQLSSVAGLSLGGMSGKDAINPDIYPDIFNSNNFIVDILKLSVINKKEEKISYYKYLTQQQDQAWWGKILASIVGKKEVSDKIDFSPTRFTRQQEQLIQNTKKNIKCEIDKKTGMISLSTTADDPFVAASLANAIMARLQQYIIDYRTKKAKIDLEYSMKILKEAKSKYSKIQQEYIHYADRHNDLVLNAYRTKLNDLENEMQQAFNSVTQINQQVEMAKARLQERTPAFTVIQEAAIPVRPSGPKRVFTVLAAFCATFFACICHSAYKSIK